MDTRKQWTLLTAIGCVALLAAGWFLLISPQRTKVSALHTQQTGVEAQTQVLRGKLHMLQAQALLKTAKQGELAKIASQIPDNPQLPALTRVLDKAAATAGVDLVSLAPGQPVVLAAQATGTPGVGAAVPAGVVAQMPVSLSLAGSYAAVEQFLTELETLPRSFLVTGFSIAPGAKAAVQTAAAAPTGPQPGIGELNVNISGRVFVAPAISAVSAALTSTGK